MSDVVIASNQSLRVNRAISGATTVNANCYAVVTYQKINLTTLTGGGGVEYGVLNTDIISRWFGPAQSIPTSFTSTVTYSTANVTATYSLLSGIEFINSP